MHLQYFKISCTRGMGGEGEVLNQVRVFYVQGLCTFQCIKSQQDVINLAIPFKREDSD